MIGIYGTVPNLLSYLPVPTYRYRVPTVDRYCRYEVARRTIQAIMRIRVRIRTYGAIFSNPLPVR